VSDEDFRKFVGGDDDDDDYSDYDLEFMLRIVRDKSDIICGLFSSTLSTYKDLKDDDPLKRDLRSLSIDLIKQARQSLDQFDFIFVDAQPEDDDV
jgi:hypothetical protein